MTTIQNKRLSLQRSTNVVITVLFGVCVMALPLLGAPETTSPSACRRPDLEYLKAVNQAAPPQDPQLLFLLMGEYANANMQAEGVDFFSQRLREFDARLRDAQRALYLSAIGLLRAQHAQAIPLLYRIGWVKETIAMLEKAKQLSGGQVFVVNWIAGMVHAQLPSRFHQQQAARQELQWCIDHVEKAPHAAWLREGYLQLAKLATADGDRTKAGEYLGRSGYTDLNRPIVLTTPFSEDVASGHAFSPRRIAEIVPRRVYVLSGFEFTEYYFVISEDGRELIGIDAGTRPDSAKTAYEALRAHVPDLPPLTTIFITHAHWDHVGGYAYFHALDPTPRFYARNNYQEELKRELNAPGNLTKYFFGERFKLDDIRTFKPDVTIDQFTELKIGGTRFNLIPVNGGETSDAMFIEMPDQGAMFVGDFIMPYLGAPFVEEGDLQGLLDATDILVERHPKHLLHGHEPLTRNFVSTTMLAQLKTDLVWLREQVLSAIRHGDENATIQQANLIPPQLLTGHPAAQVPYLLMREHVVDRLYDQNVGYWQADLTGTTHLSRADRAEVLVDYLGLSERQLVKALQHMVADGKCELASSLLEACRGRFAHSEPVRKIERLIYLKLMEQHQNSDPFKFLLYSARAREQTRQLGE